MTTYRLVFHGLDTARIRAEEASATAPLAWFRMVWAEGSNEITAVHVYGHHDEVRDRPWLATCASISDAVTLCDTFPTGSGDYDWSGGTVQTSAGGGR